MQLYRACIFIINNSNYYSFLNNKYYNYFIVNLLPLIVRRSPSLSALCVYEFPTWWCLMWTAETCSNIEWKPVIQDVCSYVYGMVKNCTWLKQRFLPHCKHTTSSSQISVCCENNTKPVPTLGGIDGTGLTQWTARRSVVPLVVPNVAVRWVAPLICIRRLQFRISVGGGVLLTGFRDAIHTSTVSQRELDVTRLMNGRRLWV